MLIVISNPTPVANEAQCINQLFEAGMQRFHLRKPGSSMEECRTLLTAINPGFYSQIALHQHHSLAIELGLHRLHFTTEARQRTGSDWWQLLKSTGCKLSTSVHTITEYAMLSPLFSYTFLGPVFDSISKPGYKPAEPIKLPPNQRRHVSLVAVGGITENNCHAAITAGFNAVAALGTIWQTPNPVKSFHQLNHSLSPYSVICHLSSVI